MLNYQRVGIMDIYDKNTHGNIMESTGIDMASPINWLPSGKLT